ncbi:unnamed protein product [Phytophthora fragariaefolia]|uniref:Unnamed protein product n=1 Tax=Phytophthora fragariaefolia TaxID=1490495 RepID=A0A9W6U6D4_9STRA|nr:unnamed protein product [Phytophthora fragariaefolia]
MYHANTTLQEDTSLVTTCMWTTTSDPLTSSSYPHSETLVSGHGMMGCINVVEVDCCTESNIELHFFIDFEGKRGDEAVDDLMADLQKNCLEVVVLHDKKGELLLGGGGWV